MDKILYKIKHYNIRHFLQNEFVLAEGKEGEGEYCVFWWDQIPLGHCWIEMGDTENVKYSSSYKHIWDAISPTLYFYCSCQLEIKFSQIVISWENKDGSCFRKILDCLLSPYLKDDQNYSSNLSLVICTRNRSQQLKKLLDSLSVLSYQPREIIVVDNAPDDEETKSLVQKYPHIKYVLEAGKGLDNARNAGWKEAISPLVAYTDDDVILHGNWVWQTERAFDDPRVKASTGIVFAAELDTKAQVIFEKYWSFNRGYRDIYYDTDYFKLHLNGGVPAWVVGAGANMAFRRSVLETVGGFDYRLDVGASGCSGDSEMWYRLMAGGWTIHYTPRAIAYHTHRRAMTALRRQIYYYMRGNTSSLLVQYQRHRHQGNLRYFFNTLTTYYAQSLIRRIRYPHSAKYRTLLQEIIGRISGIFYFVNHRVMPSESVLSLDDRAPSKNGLVSIIITTYNHERYIREAIESALHQTYTMTEVIVVDDGSTDNTSQIVAQFPQVKYIFQHNKGLSAARNTGILNSHGNYIVFLDADDLLYPSAIAKNLRYFEQYPSCAFISGGHDKVDEERKLIDTSTGSIPFQDHFFALLQSNYIGMHAAVMYRREVFDTFLFDETLPACEDYDFYLRIAKRYPVFSHNEKLAAYRIHPDNLSKNIGMMLKQVKAVLRKNADLHDKKVREFYKKGKKNWIEYYALETYHRMALRPYHGDRHTLRDLLFITGKMPKKAIRLFASKGTARLRKKGKAVPMHGKVRWGDLRRTAPISKKFGYDRGGPIDRRYIEDFLKGNAECIKGNVLEVGDNAYTMTYGRGQVTQSDILYVDDTNPQATIIGDLSAADHIPSNQFDCIILTQTLHLIYDFQNALRHCHRILKAGGTLLMTVPGITQIDYGQWHDTWYWSFTGKSIYKLLTADFRPSDVRVQTYGNVLTAVSFLYGIGKNEIKNKHLNQDDPHYQVIIAAKATKSCIRCQEMIIHG